MIEQVAAMSIEQLADAITNKGVNNISSVDIDNLIAEGLAVGLKCALPPRLKDPLETYLAEADVFVGSLTNKAFFCATNKGKITDFKPPPFWTPTGNVIELTAHNTKNDPWLKPALSELHHRLKDTISDLVLNTRAPTRQPIPREQLHAVRAFALREDITIQNADKGLGLTIMDTAWYLEKGNKLLQSGYEAVTHAQARDTISLQWNRLCRSVSASTSSPALRRLLQSKPPSAHSIPVLYLMPKLHKTPVGVRPIVAGHSYCFTPAAAVLDKSLSFSFADSQVILSDSATLIRKLEEMKITDKDCFLASADISNLYGEIPLDELRTLCVDVIRSTTDPWLLHLLDPVLYCNIIEFKGNLFRQTTGVAMGSPFGPTAANLFLHKKIDSLLTSRELFPEILAVYRYLDDVFFILASNTIIAEFHNRLNSLHSAMKFTLETSNASCDFLDITIFKGPRFGAASLLDTRVFQKPMNKFLYIPYSSFHRSTTLKAFLGTETRRFIRNSSSESSFLQTLTFFARNLRARGYPAKFITEAISTATYAQRAAYIAPRPVKDTQAFPSDLLIYKSHLDSLTKLPAFGIALKRLLKDTVEQHTASGNYKSVYLPIVLLHCSRFLVALRRSPTLYQMVINNKPTVTIRC